MFKIMRDNHIMKQGVPEVSAKAESLNGIAAVDMTSPLAILETYPPLLIASFKVTKALPAKSVICTLKHPNLVRRTTPVEFFLDRITSTADYTADRILFRLMPNGNLLNAVACTTAHRFSGSYHLIALA